MLLRANFIGERLGHLSLDPLKLGPLKLGPVGLGPLALGPLGFGPLDLGPLSVAPLSLGPLRAQDGTADYDSRPNLSEANLSRGRPCEADLA